MIEYAELHCHSTYSLLDGTDAPEALAVQAATLGIPALALTDHDAVYGAIPFISAAQEHGVQPILGAEMTLEDGHHLTLLVADGQGWRNLCALITAARHSAAKGLAALSLTQLAAHTDGLIALSGCRKGEIASALLRRDTDTARQAAARYRAWFGDRFWIELHHHLLPDDDALVAALVDLADKMGLGYVAANNVHYALPDGHRLQDVLVSIRHNTTLDDSHALRRPNSEYTLKSGGQMARLFRDYPAAIPNTLCIANQCRFDLAYGLQDLPAFPTPGNIPAIRYLYELCIEALPARYGDSLEAEELLLHELEVIERTGLANYFLIVWDITRFARDHAIRCQGRGSAANSLVVYLLGISPVDPLAHDLVFERFLSDERAAVPDIDMDFDAARREEVIQYLYRRYGPEHTAMACTFVTFRRRSAIRDVGKALGYPPIVLDRLVSQREVDDRQDPQHALLWELCDQIAGLPRHLGIHNGGMILTGAPLVDRLPTEPATMPDRVVVQWDKAMLETAGIVKIDILGLRMLSAIAETAALVEEATGTPPVLDGLTFDDPALYRQITAGDTIGVFQVESRAQAQLQPRFQPSSFDDLVVSISLIRPGPIQGNMVHPYLRRRLGVEPVSYPHPLLEDALGETLGVILFQEQVLKIARDLAGFTPGQGELLRRALGNKRAAEAIETFHAAFLSGAVMNDVPEATAEDVFSSLRAFGGYSFPKSHAAAFAVLVYQSAWLKHYHPAAFYTALLNNQPMGFWSPAVIVHDARRHGIPLLRVDVNRSARRCSLEGDGIRLGLNYVSGMGDEGSAAVQVAREHGDFRNLADFYRRTRLPRRLIERLILAGAMDTWDIPRRQLLWTLGTLHPVEGELPLAFHDQEVELPPLTSTEALALEQGVLGLSAGEHLMALHRERLREQGILGSRELEGCRDGQRVRVAGLVVMLQAPPTAKGFHFITLEDEDGMMNVIVRPQVYLRYRRVLRQAPLLLVAGVVQREVGVINVLCHVAQAWQG